MYPWILVFLLLLSIHTENWEVTLSFINHFKSYFNSFSFPLHMLQSFVAFSFVCKWSWSFITTSKKKCWWTTTLWSFRFQIPMVKNSRFPKKVLTHLHSHFLPLWFLRWNEKRWFKISNTSIFKGPWPSRHIRQYKKNRNTKKLWVSV